MKTEYEGRVLEVDVAVLEEKLKSLGATKKLDCLQRRYVYDFKPRQEKKWLRLRTNGSKTTLTIKDIQNSSIAGTKELEIEVSNFDDCHDILKTLGYEARSYQENYRIRYILDGVELDIDTWPGIPTYLEIEASSAEAVYEMAACLGYAKEQVISMDVEAIYDYYQLPVREVEVLKFEEERK